MSNAPLLDRQVSLLAYLTCGEAIFDGSPPTDPALRGIDPGHLRIEALMSYRKRMAKVRATLPETFRHLGDRGSVLLGAFARACPPEDIGRLHNARQFLAFLEDRWRREEPQPAFLRDVARLELAMAVARADGGAVPDTPPVSRRPAVRRHACVSLVRCDHDVRALFEQTADGSEPAQRELFLVVSRSAAGSDAQVLEVAAALFKLLESLDDWTPLAAIATHLGGEALSMLEALAERKLLHVAS